MQSCILSFDGCMNVECAANEWCDPSMGGVCRERLSTTVFDIGVLKEDVCKKVTCADGMECDIVSGDCVKLNALYKCYNVSCPSGKGCDWNTGRCVLFRKPFGRTPRSNQVTPLSTLNDHSDEITNLTFVVTAARNEQIRCTSNFICPSEMECDQRIGICRKMNRSESSIINAVSAGNLCSFVQCPNGFECNSSTGSCHRSRQFKRLLPRPSVCPPGSHYVDCGSACPATCSNLRRQCSAACVSTCECDESLIQLSLTNLTCIPHGQCGIGNRNMCRNLKCPEGMICMDGYCNPVNCEKLLKPGLPKGCEYELSRDKRNCLVFDIIC